MKNEALFRTGSVWRAIFTMAVPSVVLTFVLFLYNIADMFLVGCLGDTGGWPGVFNSGGCCNDAGRRRLHHHRPVLWGWGS